MLLTIDIGNTNLTLGWGEHPDGHRYPHADRDTHRYSDAGHQEHEAAGVRADALARRGIALTLRPLPTSRETEPWIRMAVPCSGWGR